MTTVKDKKQILDKQTLINNKVIFTPSKDTRLSISFWLSLVLTFLVIVAIIIGSISLYLLLTEEKKVNLFLQTFGSTPLKTTSGDTKLYTYYTQANDKTLKSYNGRYEVTVNNSAPIDFTIKDHNGMDITGDIKKGGPNLPTVINFNAVEEASEINLNYSTTNSAIYLNRIDIVFN